MDITEAAGVTTIIEPVARTDGPYKRYRTAHLFLKNGDPSPLNHHLLNPMKDNAIKCGVNILFESPAKQLVRKGNGRVAGVIMETPQGYKQVNAKAVVLCTGGYQNNPEMLAKFRANALNQAKKFDIEIILPQYEEYYQEVMEHAKLALADAQAAGRSQISFYQKATARQATG